MMRHIIIFLLKNSFIISFIYNSFFRIKNKKKFDYEIIHRKKISIFSYKELAKPIPFCPYERIKDSNYYGHLFFLKRYCNLKKIDYAIEHGLYYDNYIPKASFYRTTKRIITFSNERKKIIQSKLNKFVVPIGPYIHYADFYIDEKETKLLKEKLGKTLLFFPVHSCFEGMNSFDIQSIIDKIKVFTKKYNFDTVIVNMYYYDILNTDYDEYYKQAGFRIVTSGNQLDFNFISRLKTIISLSDYTISNSVGTHTGYCIWMKKPHFIIDRSIIDIEDSIMYKEIGSEFLNYSPIITESQYQVVSKYWGFDCIKSNNELSQILK